MTVEAVAAPEPLVDPENPAAGLTAPGRSGKAIYVIAVALCFWYFWPLYTAQSIPYDSWWKHLWLGNRWV